MEIATDRTSQIVCAEDRVRKLAVCVHLHVLGGQRITSGGVDPHMTSALLFQMVSHWPAVG